MHKFLRAVGFSEITKEELNHIFEKVMDCPTFQKVAEDRFKNSAQIRQPLPLKNP